MFLSPVEAAVRVPRSKILVKFLAPRHGRVLMPSQKILIIGATSAIAQETARLFAAGGADLFLVGRSSEKLVALSADLKARGSSHVFTKAIDLDRLCDHDAVLDEAIRRLGGCERVLIAHGILGVQKSDELAFE